MFNEVEKAGKMAQDRLAAIPPEQVKRIADNVEGITLGVKQIIEIIRDSLLLVKAKFEGDHHEG